MTRRGGRRIHGLSPREDVERELRSHLELREAELVAAGWDPAAARTEAERLFGDYATIRRECRDLAERHARSTRRTRMWSELRQDVAYAVRWLARAPDFAVLAVITLALGIGATSAAFTIVNGVLLAPLPYPDAERLVAVWERADDGGDIRLGWPNYRDWRDGTQSLAKLAAYQSVQRVTVLGGADALRAPVAGVTGNLFDVLKVAPALGRGWVAEELVPGGRPALIVSDGFWRRQLGASRSLDDLRLEVFGMTGQVVGVMPPGFDFPGKADIWLPLDLIPESQLGTRSAHNFKAVGRLASGASIAAAQQELSALAERIRARDGDSEAFGANVRGLREDAVGDARRALIILLGASGFVLLVACTNLASALLARAARRRQELAVRASLGASRLRLMRQLLTESAVLSLLGAAAGLALAQVLLRVAVVLGSDAIPRLETVQLDGWVLAFTTLVALATALAFGTAPALRATSTPPQDALREGGRGTETPRQRRAWTLLVGSEVAVALLLLVGCGLLIRSFQELLRVDPGFEIEDRLAVQLSLPASRYDDTDARVRYYDALIQRVNALPGVRSAALTMSMPLVDGDPNGMFDIEGGEEGEGYASYRVVSPGFFAASGTPILRGREFNANDRAGSAEVILVNRELVRRFFRDADPIGRRMRTGGMDEKGDDFVTIVGIVGDVHFESLEADPEPAYYLPHTQRPHRLLNATLLVHVPSSSERAGDIRRAVIAIDDQVAVDVASLEQRTSASLADRRFMLLVLGVFAGIALLLAGVGIYGVVAFAVAQRTREIAIRLALGAASKRVLWSVGRSTIVSVGAGIVLGLLAATWLARLVASLLYEVRPFDPFTYALVALVLATIAAAAVLVPASRALRVSPIAALRGD